MAAPRNRVIITGGAHPDLTKTPGTRYCWQADSGLDAHSIQADPMFADPKRGDFTLLEDSPCIGAGEGGVDMGALDPLMLSRE